MADDDQYDDTLQIQQQAPAGRSSYHNRTATLADGTRVIWQEAPNGRGGRFVRMSESTAAPAAREVLQNARGRLATYSRLAPLAQRFVGINRQTPTGGWVANSYQRERSAAEDPTNHDMWHGLNFPLGLMDIPFGGQERNNLDTMYALQNQALRERIQPGTSGASNTVAEQAPQRSYFPSITNIGSANLDIASQALAERDLEQRHVAGLQNWLTTHPDLNGFDAKWNASYAAMQPRQQEYYQRYLTNASGQLPARLNPMNDAPKGIPQRVGDWRQQGPKGAAPAYEPAYQAPPPRTSAPPAGVTQAEWSAMTDSERALWRIR